MVTDKTLGSARWVERVFASPPVDRIKGRSRHTQAHAPFCRQLGRPVPLQGRLEFHSWTLLEYLIRAGVVRRAKEHAFVTSLADLGWETRPDFLAVSAVGDLLVIETKTSRFITRATELELEANADAFEKFGMRYLVWTDRYPLTRAVRHNLLHMRRQAGEVVSPVEIEALHQRVARQPQITVGDLMKEDFDLGCIYAAWWRCRVLLPLTLPPTMATQVATSPAENYESMFLAARPVANSWWNSLPDA